MIKLTDKRYTWSRDMISKLNGCTVYVGNLSKYIHDHTYKSVDILKIGEETLKAYKEVKYEVFPKTIKVLDDISLAIWLPFIRQTFMQNYLQNIYYVINQGYTKVYYTCLLEYEAGINVYPTMVYRRENYTKNNICITGSYQSFNSLMALSDDVTQLRTIMLETEDLYGFKTIFLDAFSFFDIIMQFSEEDFYTFNDHLGNIKLFMDLVEKNGFNQHTLQIYFEERDFYMEAEDGDDHTIHDLVYRPYWYVDGKLTFPMRIDVEDSYILNGKIQSMTEIQR